MVGIFVGLALGVFQVLVLRKSVLMMTQSKTNIPLGVMISVGKLALILLVLWLLAKYVSLESVLWCAGGLAVSMIGLPIILNAQAVKNLAKKGEGSKE